MAIALQHYKTLIFDCDGVVLDSNHAKIDAYRAVALQFGANATQAEALVQHHQQLGGISRYPKFAYFLREIMRQAVTESAIQQLLQAFTHEVKQRLQHCTISPHLQALKAASGDIPWMLLSGGDQQELREILAQKQLAHYFNAGIFGSPDNKDQVLAREIACANVQLPALFIGDSRYDYEASTRAGCDFVFLTDWTDMPAWQAFCSEQQIHTRRHLGDLLAS